MMSKFEKLLAKKKEASPEMDDVEQDAKMAVVNHMRDMAMGDLGKKLKDGMGKVTVASDSPEGLKSGLDKAKELLAAKGPEGSPEHEAAESPEFEAGEREEALLHGEDNEDEESPEEESQEKPDEELSEDEIDQKLQKLMHLKAVKSKGKMV